MGLLGKCSKTEINPIQVEIFEWKIKYGSPFVKFFIAIFNFLWKKYRERR